MFRKIDRWVDKQKYALGFAKPTYTLDEVTSRVFNKKELPEIVEKKKQHPLEWFVYVTLYDSIYDFFSGINQKVYNIKCYLSNGLKGEHKITLGKFGQWFECEQKISISLEHTLIDFVESQCDHMYKIFWKEKYQKDIKAGKKLNYGVKYLKIMMNDKDNHKETRKAYEEILDAYIYFTNTRKKYLKSLKKKHDTWFKQRKKDKEKSLQTLKEYSSMEVFINNEDTKFYTLIVKNRLHMWT